MSQTVSSSATRSYGLAFTCRVLEIPRSTVYAVRARELTPPPEPRKRGPKTAWTDGELTELVRSALARSPFVGEGYRKAWARLRHEGIRTSKARVLRLMRQANLLAPTRCTRPAIVATHDGTITTDRPDLMWGTDATSTWTAEGVATIFFAVDHCTSECIGIHAARYGTRFEALEPIRQGIRHHYPAYAADVAAGLALRHDHGSQYMSDHFQGELRWLGIESSPAFVRQPEGNGCAERFVRTLKEQLLWLQHFATVDELSAALHAFRVRYNAGWLVARHAHQSPDAIRRAFTEVVAA